MHLNAMTLLPFRGARSYIGNRATAMWVSAAFWQARQMSAMHPSAAMGAAAAGQAAAVSAAGGLPSPHGHGHAGQHHDAKMAEKIVSELQVRFLKWRKGQLEFGLVSKLALE